MKKSLCGVKLNILRELLIVALIGSLLPACGVGTNYSGRRTSLYKKKVRRVPPRRVVKQPPKRFVGNCPVIDKSKSSRSAHVSRWSAKVNIDRDCPTKASVNLAMQLPKLTSLAALEAKAVDVFSSGIESLKQVLNLAAPGVTKKIVRVGSRTKGHELQLSAAIIFNDLGYFRGGVPKIGLQAIVDSFAQHSISDSTPIDFGTLCVSVLPLAKAMGLQWGHDKTHLVYNAPYSVIQDLIQFKVHHMRKAVLSLESTVGVVYAKRELDWPGLVSIDANKCGCDVMISAKALRTGVTRQVDLPWLDTRLMANNSQLAIRMSEPGTPLRAGITVTPNPEPKNITTQMHMDRLFRSAFLQMPMVSRVDRGESSVVIALESRPALGTAIPSSWAKTVGALTRGQSRPHKNICFQDYSGKEMLRVALDRSRTALLESSLEGLDDMRTSISLNHKKAGLSGEGYSELPMGTETIERLVRIQRSNPNATLRVSFSEKPALERSAWVMLPVKRRDGSEHKLPVKVDVGQALSVGTEDEVTFVGPGVAFKVPLSSFSDPVAVYKALTTPWGVLKSLRVPVKAIRIARSTAVASYKTGEYDLEVYAQDSHGSVIGSSLLSMPLRMEVSRPLFGSCGYVFRQLEKSRQQLVEISGLSPLAVASYRKARVVDIGANTISIRYLVPPKCASDKLQGTNTACVDVNNVKSPAQ